MWKHYSQYSIIGTDGPLYFTCNKETCSSCSYIFNIQLSTPLFVKKAQLQIWCMCQVERVIHIFEAQARLSYPLHIRNHRDGEKFCKEVFLHSGCLHCVNIWNCISCRCWLGFRENFTWGHRVVAPTSGHCSRPCSILQGLLSHTRRCGSLGKMPLP